MQVFLRYMSMICIGQRIMKKVLLTVLVLLLCCGCQSGQKASDETVKEDPVQNETEKEEILINEISD